MPDVPFDVLRIMTALAALAGTWLLWRFAHTNRINPARAGALASLLAAGLVFTLIAPYIVYDHVLATSTTAAVAWALFAASAVLSGALLTAALIGDRSRGRRRCPSCWYDMSAIPGLTCPECGHDATSERNLFRSRRNSRYITAAFLPFAAGAVGLALWLNNRPRWTDEVPTFALSILSTWADFSDQLPGQLEDRMRRQTVNGPPATDRERDLQVRASRFALRVRWNRHAILYHATLLTDLAEVNSSSTAAVIRITRANDATSARKAVDLLGRIKPDTPEASAAEAELIDLLADPIRKHLRPGAVISLYNLKEDHRGGAPPPGLITFASGPNMTPPALNLLAMYDPSPQSRDILVAVARKGSGWASASAVSALTNLYPDDPEVHTLLIAELAKTPKPGEPSIIDLLLWHDVVAARAGPAAVTRRRTLYTPSVRRALLDAIATSPSPRNPARLDSWPVAKETFTPEEKGELNHLWNRDDPNGG